MAYGEVHITLLTYIRSTAHVEALNLASILARIRGALDPPAGDAPDALAPDTPPNAPALPAALALPDVPAPDLDLYIAAINLRISPTGFRIAKHRHQVLGAMYYVFVNTAADVITRLHTSYSAAELDAIKHLIDDLTDDTSYSLGYVNLSQRISQTLGKTAREANALLNRLIDDGWFDLTEENRLLLSLRSMCELRPFLLDRYADEGRLYTCHQCKELVTMGFKCPLACPVALHQLCLAFHQRHARAACPACHTPWSTMTRLGVLPETLAP